MHFVNLIVLSIWCHVRNQPRCLIFKPIQMNWSIFIKHFFFVYFQVEQGEANLTPTSDDLEVTMQGHGPIDGFGSSYTRCPKPDNVSWPNVQRQPGGMAVILLADDPWPGVGSWPLCWTEVNGGGGGGGRLCIVYIFLLHCLHVTVSAVPPLVLGLEWVLKTALSTCTLTTDPNSSNREI